MQRPDAKNPPERPLLSAETGNSKIGVKNTRRNGLFSIDDGFRSSGRLDGGGSSPAKPVSNAEFPANSENYRELFKFGHPKRLLVRETPRAAASSVSIPYAK
jgi:hypothetical protein